MRNNKTHPRGRTLTRACVTTTPPVFLMKLPYTGFAPKTIPLPLLNLPRRTPSILFATPSTRFVRAPFAVEPFVFFSSPSYYYYNNIILDTLHYGHIFLFYFLHGYRVSEEDGIEGKNRQRRIFSSREKDRGEKMF